MSVRCKECGCRDVQIACWVVANTNEVVDPVSDVDAWCPVCEGETDIEECDDDEPDDGFESPLDAVLGLAELSRRCESELGASLG